MTNPNIQNHSARSTNLNVESDNTSQSTQATGRFVRSGQTQSTTPVQHKPSKLAELQAQGVIPFYQKETATAARSATVSGQRVTLRAMNADELEASLTQLTAQLEGMLVQDAPLDENQKKSISETNRQIQDAKKEYKIALGMREAMAKPLTPKWGVERQDYLSAGAYLVASEDLVKGAGRFSNSAEYDNYLKKTVHRRAGTPNNDFGPRRNALLANWYADACNTAHTNKAAHNTKVDPNIDSGLFSQARSCNELSVGNIVKQAFSKTTAWDAKLVYEKGIDPDEPMLLRGTYALRNTEDIKNLIAELDKSRSPFHVISILGKEDGTYERSYVFAKMKLPVERGLSAPRTWTMIPESGGAINPFLPTLGQAKNIDPPPQIMLDMKSTQNPRKRTIAQQETASLAKPHTGQMDIGVCGDGAPPNTNVLDAFLTTHLQKKDQASIVVMSPKTASVKNTLEGLKHMGYEMRYDEKDDGSTLNIFTTLELMGCDVQNERMNTNQLLDLAHGFFDQPKNSYALFVQGDSANVAIAWDSGNPGVARNLETGAIIRGKPSEFWKDMSSSMNVTSVTQVFVAPSEVANAFSLLTGAEKKDMQLALHRAAAEEGLSTEEVQNFDMLAYLFGKNNPDAVSVRYNMDKLNDHAYRQLGAALNGCNGNLLLEFDNGEDENGLPQTERYCFQAPGQNATPTAIATSLSNSDQHVRPSDLLDQVRALSPDEVREVRILSTQPLSTLAINTGSVPEQVYDGLHTLRAAGLPIDVHDLSTQQDFTRFLRETYGGIPAELRNEMYAKYVARWSAAQGETNPVDIERWLSPSGSLQLPAYPLGYVLQFEDALGRMNTIDFKLGGDGRVFFVDPTGTKYDVSEIDRIAGAQHWWQQGPVEILRLQGNSLSYVLESEETWSESGDEDQLEHSPPEVDSTNWEDLGLAPGEYWTQSRGDDYDADTVFELEGEEEEVSPSIAGRKRERDEDDDGDASPTNKRRPS